MSAAELDKRIAAFVEELLGKQLRVAGWSWLRFAQAAKVGQIDPDEVLELALRAAHLTTPPDLGHAGRAVTEWVRALAHDHQERAAHRFIRAGSLRVPVYRCDACEAEIVWARTVNSKNMPVNATPTSKGTQILRVANGVLVVRTLHAEEQPAEGERRWTSHYALCPAAARFRDTPAPAAPAEPLTALPARSGAGGAR